MILASGARRARGTVALAPILARGPRAGDAAVAPLEVHAQREQLGRSSESQMCVRFFKFLAIHPPVSNEKKIALLFNLFMD
jgi:hypothetical protein